MGLTYFGHPVACTAALKNVEIIENEGLLQNARDVGAYFQQTAQALRDLPIVGDVRGYGLMMAVDLVADKATKEPFSVTAGMGGRVFAKCVQGGIIVRPVGDRIVLSPPIIIDKGECDTIVSVLGDAIRSECG